MRVSQATDTLRVHAHVLTVICKHISCLLCVCVCVSVGLDAAEAPHVL